jgi:hypothetical protein
LILILRRNCGFYFKSNTIASTIYLLNAIASTVSHNFQAIASTINLLKAIAITMILDFQAIAYQILNFVIAIPVSRDFQAIGFNFYGYNLQFSFSIGE